MKARVIIRMCVPAAVLLSAGGFAGYVSGNAAGDNTPPITVTTTTPTVSTPAPLPAPVPAPKPKPAPVQHPRTVQPPATTQPAPAAHTSSPSAGSAPTVTPSAPRSTPAKPAVHSHAQPTKRPRHRATVRAKHSKPKPTSAGSPPSPTRETEQPSSQGGTLHSKLLFFVLTAMLLAIGAATVVLSPRARAKWAPAGARVRMRRRRPEAREVIAELVRTPSMRSGPAAIAPPPATVEPESTIPAKPVFAPEMLLQPPRGTPAVAANNGDRAAEAEVVAAPPPASARGSVEDEAAVATEEYCQISIWRGYAKSRFYARLEVGDADEEFAVAESPTFRMRGNGTPKRTDDAVAAHTALIEALHDEGWETEGLAGPWYAARFRRPVAAEQEPAPALRS